MKTEQHRLVLRFAGFAMAIAVIIGMTALVARWTGPLG